jgi:hypothetical protein
MISANLKTNQDALILGGGEVASDKGEHPMKAGMNRMQGILVGNNTRM